jgi:hypothetical protein
MRQKDVRLDGPFGQVIDHEGIAEGANSGPRIDDNYPIVRSDPQLNAGCISTVFLGSGAWAGNGSTNPPKANLHVCILQFNASEIAEIAEIAFLGL